MAKVIRTKIRDGRKLPENEPRSYEIAEMRSRHFRMVELDFLGYSEKYIGEFLGVTSQNVSDVLNSELAKVHLEALRLARDEDSVSVAKQLKELAPEALSLIRMSMNRQRVDMIKDPDMKIDKTHKEIAFDVLDRAGHGVPKQANQFHLHLTKSNINNIKNYNEEEQNEIPKAVTV